MKMKTPLFRIPCLALLASASVMLLSACGERDASGKRKIGDPPPPSEHPNPNSTNQAPSDHAEPKR